MGADAQGHVPSGIRDSRRRRFSARQAARATCWATFFFAPAPSDHSPPMPSEATKRSAARSHASVAKPQSPVNTGYGEDAQGLSRARCRIRSPSEPKNMRWWLPRRRTCGRWCRTTASPALPTKDRGGRCTMSKQPHFEAVEHPSEQERSRPSSGRGWIRRAAARGLWCPSSARCRAMRVPPSYLLAVQV